MKDNRLIFLVGKFDKYGICRLERREVIDGVLQSAACVAEAGQVATRMRGPGASSCKGTDGGRRSAVSSTQSLRISPPNGAQCGHPV